jgi:hypothetical protein
MLYFLRSARTSMITATIAIIALRQIADIANAELERLDKNGKAYCAEEDELDALRSHWKKPNGRLTRAGVRERARCQKAGMSSRQIAKRMAIDESAARYVPTPR